MAQILNYIILKMKKILFLAISAFFALTFNATAQSADAVLDAYFDKIGGKDKWREIKTIKMDGVVKMQGMEIGLTVSTVHQEGMRTDISLMGMTGYEFITNTEGWSFMPFQGQTKPEATPADIVKERQGSLDAQSELLDYASKGHTVEYVGVEDVEGTECSKLKFTSKAGVITYYYFDNDSKLLIQTVNKMKAAGKEMESKTILTNYKDVDGRKMPHEIISEMGPLEIKNIVVNGPIDKSAFATPSLEPAQGK